MHSNKKGRWHNFFKYASTYILLLLFCHSLQASQITSVRRPQFYSHFDEVVSFFSLKDSIENPWSFINNNVALKINLNKQDKAQSSCVALSIMPCLIKNSFGIPLFVKSQLMFVFIEWIITENLNHSDNQQLNNQQKLGVE